MRESVECRKLDTPQNPRQSIAGPGTSTQLPPEEFAMSGGMQIFRPEALERLASPEQLDELMVVTDSKAWISLIAIGIILAVALGWSIFGSVPTSIQGDGVLLREGGIYDIQAGGSGRVVSLLTAEDSLVGEGELIGSIAQPELATRMSINQQRLLVLRGFREEQLRIGDRNLAIALDVVAQDSVRLERELATAAGRLSELRQRLEDTRFAQQQGFYTQQTVVTVEQELSRALSDSAQIHIALTQIPGRLLQAQEERQTTIRQIDRQIQQVQQDSILFESQLTEANEIRSPHNGHITQLMVDVGQIVGAGTPVASLELVDRPVEAVIFVPVVGAKARAGLEAHVQPLTVNWQEHGYIVGTVEFVSQTPVTVARMNRVLKNDRLSQDLSRAGDPYLLEISLNQAETPTGFEWTSGVGPDSTVTLHSGILASAKIIVDTQRPIALVIPAVRSLFGF